MLKLGRFPPYLLMAIAGILISASIASFLQNVSSSESNDLAEHGMQHGLISESQAVRYPLEISELYKVVRTEGDVDYGELYLQYHEDVINSERSCEFCTFVEYIPGPIGESEISFTSFTGYDLSGARKVTFFIMGAEGEETVTVKVAGKEKEQNNIHYGSAPAEKGKGAKEFAATTKPIKLGKQWNKLEIDLSQKSDLTEITDAFTVVVKASDNKGEPVAFYIKQVMYESSSANNPIPLADDFASQIQGASRG